MASAPSHTDADPPDTTSMGLTEDDIYDISYATDQAEELLAHCQEAMGLVHESDQQILNCGCFHGLASLEDLALNAAASPNVVQALLYCAAIKTGDHIVIRYLEAGSQVTGFMEKEGRSFFSERFHQPTELLCIFTSEDVKRNLEHMGNVRRSKSAAQATKSSSKQRGERVAERWTRLKDGYKGSASKCLNADCTKLLDHMAVDGGCGSLIGLVVIARRSKQDFSNVKHRFETLRLHGFDDSEAELKQLCDRLDTFASCGDDCSPVSLNTLTNCLEMPSTLSKQFALLSCVSNYHWGSRPKHSESGFTSRSSHIPFTSHFSFTPESSGEGHDRRLSTTHLPNSPRNLIIFYSCSDRADSVQCRKHIFSLLRSSVHAFSSSFSEEADYSHCLPPIKKRRCARPAEPQELPPGSLQLDANMADCVGSDLFKGFVQHMTSGEALLSWRLHDSTSDVFVMNNMDAQTGAVQPSSVVHVIRHQYESQVSYSCTCEIYRHVQNSSLNVQERVFDNSLISSSVTFQSTCAHCRFIREHLEEHMPSVTSGSVSTSKMYRILKKSSTGLNSPVLPVGDHTSQTIAKFSVMPGSDVAPSFVHVSRHGFISCQSGECRAKCGTTKGIKRLSTLYKSRSLCPHLSCVAANPGSVEEVASSRQPADGDNIDDDDILEEVYVSKKLFNVTSGKWEIPAYSKHRPAQESTELSRSIMERLSMVHAGAVSEDGYIIGPKLIPQCPEQCDCGAGYSKEEPCLIEDGIKIIYTRNAPMKCRSMKWLCNNRRCTQSYTGKEDNIFFLSSQTGVCDEIGWDFINCIVGSKTSFTFFCNNITRTYKSNCASSCPFISRSSFVSWWFAWIAAHDIDFRKNVDPQCCGSRKILACDGTHVGVSLSNLNVIPIETPTNANISVDPSHKRYNRVFMYYPLNSSKYEQDRIRSARIHLRTESAYVLGRLEADNDMEDVEREQQNQNLFDVCPQDAACTRMMHIFLESDELPQNIKRSLAEMFYILSGDAAVSAFIPLRFCDHFLSVCDAFQGEINAHALRLLDEMREYCPELSHLLGVSKNSTILNHILAFIRYLVNFVNKVHENDRPADPAVPIPGTYDPESGVAYYFTDHGCRVRDLPVYSLNSTRHQQDLYDDAPGQDNCNKKKVYPGGFNYTFFWFCPIHGHCLGFHLMPGAEGRRDPFSSLLAYLPEAPEEVFYDFACSFSEYSLNREPHYYKNTRFWHDLFHGFAHKCPSSLKSSRIPSLTGLDTEICEQFNAFLQNIKYTGSHMTQSHFCLYLQFMIHVWNCRKDQRCLNMDNVAVGVNHVDD